MTKSSRRAPPAPLPSLHGLIEPRWARVHRLQLIRREVREFLPDTTIDLLLESAELVVEGGPALGRAPSEQAVFATLMITVDLCQTKHAFREPADEATALRVCELLVGHPALEPRLLAWIQPTLEQLCGAPSEGYAVELEISLRHEGTSILIDADLEARPEESE